MNGTLGDVRSREDNVYCTPLKPAADHGRETRGEYGRALNGFIQLDQHIDIAASPCIVQARAKQPNTGAGTAFAAHHLADRVYVVGTDSHVFHYKPDVYRRPNEGPNGVDTIVAGLFSLGGASARGLRSCGNVLALTD